MDKRSKLRTFILPGIVILFVIMIYSRLGGTENVKSIHIVSLIGLGMAIGILVRNIFTYFFGKR